MADSECFDLVIAGGGLVGASAALALAQSCPGLSIAIVERVPADADHQPSFDCRSVALGHGSKVLLERYGLWSALQQRVTPIVDIQVSDRGHIGKTYLSAQQFNLPALGFVAQVRDLGRALTGKLDTVTRVQWFCPDSIAQINEYPDHLELALDSGQRLHGKLLLVADGTQSATRRQMDIANSVSDYGQTAVIANVRVSQPHHHRAFERFTEFGPIALLPLPDQCYSLVWCVPPEQAQSLVDCDDRAFIAQLQQAFGYRAGRLVKVGKRFSYPLTLTLADDIVAHRVALLGNASHTIHPIAGQGFNLGLRDVEALRSTLVAALDSDQDIGSFATLRQFQQLRQQDLRRVVGMTDGLVRVFSQHNKPLALARTMGLLAMQLFDGLKQPLVFQAMGWRAD